MVLPQSGDTGDTMWLNWDISLTARSKLSGPNRLRLAAFDRKMTILS